jgi:hypothetical protein
LDQLPFNTVIAKITGTLTKETSGISHVPLSQAEGTVVFTNQSLQEIMIPADTIVRTSMEGGIRYRTTKQATLPAEIGAEVEVPIEALTLGRIGNVRMNTITYIEGTLGLILKVTNLRSLVGGADEIRGMVTIGDLQSIEQGLLEEMLRQAEMELKGSISSDQILIEGTTEPRKIHESHYSHSEGDVADTVSLEMSIEFATSSLDVHDIQGLVIESLSDDVPDGYQIIQDSVVFQSAKVDSSSDAEKQSIIIVVELDTYQTFNVESIKSAIQGKSMSVTLKTLLEQLDLAIDPEIFMDPDWFPFLPVFGERIELRTDVE